MSRKFRFTQTNSAPFSGLDGTVLFGNGADSTDKILLLGATGLGMDGLQTQVQKAPFQQGASMIRTLFDTRLITLECAIAVPGANSKNASTVTTIKRSLSKKLSPVGMGFLPDTSLTSSDYSTYTGTLEYAYDGTTFDRTINAVPMTVEYPNAYYKDSFQKVRFVFFCPDPFWYGAEQTSTLANVSVGLSGTWVSICWSPELGLFCAIAQSSNSIQTSPDGITWTLRTGSGSNTWNAVCWSPDLGLFCAVCNGSSAVQTSPDGITWTARTGQSGQWYSITWSSYLGLFCVVGNATNYVETSPDGITWTVRTPASTAGWRAVCWSPERKLFCALGNTTNIQTSPDGVNWTLRTGASSATWVSICWSPELSLFCAVAQGTGLQTSPDGITWTSRTNAGSYTWQSVTWSSQLGLFCAVASSSTAIQTSSDGITWTLRTAPVSATWYSITWSPQLGAFCAIAFTAAQYPMISYDGINWAQNSATTDWYVSVQNTGDVPATFTLTVPIAGGETGKVIAVGENFLWAGSGSPPSDHNIVVSTTGLPVGSVVLKTTFGQKSITQFGNSIMNKLVGGTFFSLYVTGAKSNILYVRNTGTPSSAPSIKWRNRYISV